MAPHSRHVMLSGFTDDRTETAGTGASTVCAAVGAGNLASASWTDEMRTATSLFEMRLFSTVAATIEAVSSRRAFSIMHDR